MAAPRLGIDGGEFERIEAAVREIERGRWFLDEFARRVRASGTTRFLAAFDRLEEQAACRQASDDEARRNIQRVISLLASLVDYLIEHKAAADRGAETPLILEDEFDAYSAALASLDSLSVADKLKHFR